MTLIYENCEFVPRFPCCTAGKIIYETITLIAIKGSILKIPSEYDGNVIRTVDVSARASMKDSLDYFKPAPEEFSFYSVEEIHIPESVERIQLNRLLFPNLKKVVVVPKNKFYKTFDDCLFSCMLGFDKVLCLVAYYGDSEKFVIPDSVFVIGDFSFSFTKLRSIKFPEHLQCDSIKPFLYSKWFENFEGAIDCNKTVLAFRKEVDEFVISDVKCLCTSTFQYAVPKKVVLNIKDLHNPLPIFPHGLSCVELRHCRLKLNNIMSEFIRNASSIIVNSESKYYCSIDGVVFSKDKTELLLYPKFKKDRQYTVPEGVIKIVDHAFKSNNYCEVLQLPTTLKDFSFGCAYSLGKLQEIVFPELDPSFRFSSLKSNFIKRIKLPSSMTVLPSHSFIMYNAIIEATNVQYFMSEAVGCKTLLVGNEVRYADKGAFCSAEVLVIPEYKIFNFAETLFPVDKKKDNAISQIHHVIVTRDNGSQLRLAIPMVFESIYLETMFGFWSSNGIDLEKYIKALLRIKKDVDIKYDSLCYFIENNEEFCEIVFSCISRIMCGFLSWLIKNGKLEIISFLCGKGAVSSIVAKKLLRKDFPAELIPVFMSVLQGSESSDLSL